MGNEPNKFLLHDRGKQILRQETGFERYLPLLFLWGKDRCSWSERIRKKLPSRILAGIDKEFNGETVLSPGYTVGLFEQEPNSMRKDGP